MVGYKIHSDGCDAYEELELLRRLFHGLHAVPEVVIARSVDAASVVQITNARLVDVGLGEGRARPPHAAVQLAL